METGQPHDNSPQEPTPAPFEHTLLPPAFGVGEETVQSPEQVHADAMSSAIGGTVLRESGFVETSKTILKDAVARADKNLLLLSDTVREGAKDLGDATVIALDGLRIRVAERKQKRLDKNNQARLDARNPTKHSTVLKQHLLATDTWLDGGDKLTRNGEVITAPAFHDDEPQDPFQMSVGDYRKHLLAKTSVKNESDFRPEARKYAEPVPGAVPRSRRERAYVRSITRSQAEADLRGGRIQNNILDTWVGDTTTISDKSILAKKLGLLVAEEDRPAEGIRKGDKLLVTMVGDELVRVPWDGKNKADEMRRLKELRFLHDDFIESSGFTGAEKRRAKKAQKKYRKNIKYVQKRNKIVDSVYPYQDAETLELAQIDYELDREDLDDRIAELNERIADTRVSRASRRVTPHHS